MDDLAGPICDVMKSQVVRAVCALDLNAEETVIRAVARNGRLADVGYPVLLTVWVADPGHRAFDDHRVTAVEENVGLPDLLIEANSAAIDAKMKIWRSQST
jgi:hypothetical protein